MRRFLVVGCCGSGGATLAFIMDQLRSELHAAGIDKLLAGWQFVQIDVPSAPETGPEGLANVPAGMEEAVIESAEECPGECIFIEVE